MYTSTIISIMHDHFSCLSHILLMPEFSKGAKRYKAKYAFYEL